MGMKKKSNQPQKQSEHPFGHSPESAHSKSEKMEAYHESYVAKKKQK